MTGGDSGYQRTSEVNIIWKLEKRRTWDTWVDQRKVACMLIQGASRSSRGRTPKEFRTRRAGPLKAEVQRGAENGRLHRMYVEGTERSLGSLSHPQKPGESPLRIFLLPAPRTRKSGLYLSGGDKDSNRGNGHSMKKRILAGDMCESPT